MKRSLQTRLKMSIAKKGFVPWNKGKVGNAKGSFFGFIIKKLLNVGGT